MTSYVRSSFLLATAGFIAVSFSSCSVDQNATQDSNVNSIASPSGDTNILYWQDQTDLFRGTCLPAKPINRVNCATNVIKVPAAEISKRSMTNGQRGVDTVAAAIATEIRTLRGNDPTVLSLNQQIAALTRQKPALQSAVTAAKTQLVADSTSKAQVEERLVYVNQQLKAVEKELIKTPNDQILLDLQRNLRIDQLQSEAKNVELAERVAISQKRLTTQQNILAKIDADLAEKQNELKLYSDTLDVFSPRLEQLKAQKAEADATIAAVPKVMAFVADGNVVYRGNILPKDLTAALAIIDRSFTSTF